MYANVRIPLHDETAPTGISNPTLAGGIVPLTGTAGNFLRCFVAEGSRADLRANMALSIKGFIKAIRTPMQLLDLFCRTSLGEILRADALRSAIVSGFDKFSMRRVVTDNDGSDEMLSVGAATKRF